MSYTQQLSIVLRHPVLLYKYNFYLEKYFSHYKPYLLIEIFIPLMKYYFPIEI